ncbi:hypothetical protein BV898_17969, partial [Hypsibius exemplaris]
AAVPEEGDFNKSPIINPGVAVCGRSTYGPARLDAKEVFVSTVQGPYKREDA